jgi:rhodanese-related sulfurtransferase
MMNKKIVYTVILAAFVFLIVMYIVREKAPAYTLTLEESLKDAMKPGNVVSLEELDMVIASKEEIKHVFVDIRTPYDFVKGHLDKALNIPYNSMLSDENLDIFKRLKKEQVDVILYGNDQSQANAPCILLRQMGYNNVRLLAGGYSAYTAPADSLGNKPMVNEELAAYNFGKEMKKITPVTKINSNQAEIPRLKIVPVEKKKKGAEGGC